MADTNLIDVANRILNTLGSLAVEDIAGELKKLKEIVSKIPGVLDDATIRAGLKIPKVRDWLEKLEDALFDADEILDDAPDKKTDPKLVGARKQLEKLVKKKPNPINVANRILNTPGSLAVEEIAGELKELKEIVSKIPGVLDDATIRAVRNIPEVRDWLEKLEAALFDADEILDEALGDTTDSKLVEVTKQLEKLVEEKPSFNPDHTPAVDTEREISNDGDKVREADKQALINLLLGSGIDETVSVISIFGLRGIGKTRLAHRIFNDARMKTSFQLRLWVGVSQLEFSPIHLADEIIKFVTGRSRENPESKLEKFVEGRKLLLVLNDVQIQKFDSDRWLGFKRLLMGGAEGSRVLITTSSKDVASMTATVRPYEVKLLSAEMDLMGGAEGSGVLTKTHRKEVASVTATVLPYEAKPLSAELDLMGGAEGSGVLTTTRSKEVASMTATDRPHEVTLKNFHNLYNGLPQHLRNCFAYCSLFPEDHEFDVSTLNKIWVAQDFTDEGTDPDSKTGLDILVKNGFFKTVGTEGSATRSKCKIADAVHEFARNVGGKQSIKLDSVYQNSGDLTTRHVSIDFPLSSLRRIPTSLKSTKEIRSIVVFPYQQSGKCKDGSNQAIFDAFVSNFKSLRTLDLHYSGIKTVPPKIDSLVELRYLDLSKNTKLKVLPNSITKLTKLQTLKLSWCFGLQELPRDIKNLVKLRHLEIDGCYNLTHMPSGLGKLRDLQTLSQFVLSKEANPVPGHVGELQELRELDNLQGDLQIRNLRPGHNVRDICLEKKQGLQSLTLDWGAVAVGLDYKKLLEDSLREPITIPNMAFNGYGGVYLPNWLSRSQNLVKLELRRCSECKFLPPLHSCPSLETLVLDDMTKLEYIAEDHVVKDIFPRLKELRLTELPMLKGWWKSTSPEVNHEVPVFPTLSKLSIEDCPKLVSMPLFPKLKEGLVLDSTSWNPFEQMMKMADRASSSSSPSVYLSQLMNLSIVGIEKLDDIAANAIEWKALENLQFLRLDSLPDLKSLPDGLRSITSLQELTIWRCNVSRIPDWIDELQSLKKLSIWVCPAMKSLPENIRTMTSLLTLEIEECPILLQRCLRNGADFDKISRIPNKRLGLMSKQ